MKRHYSNYFYELPKLLEWLDWHQSYKIISIFKDDDARYIVIFQTEN